MKKALSLLIAIILAIVCLASCDEGVTHLGHKYKYIPYEQGHFKQYTCGCPSPDILEEHYDRDSDLFCDACGHVVSNPSCGDTKWQSSETHHWWLPEPEGEVMIDIVYGYGEHEDMDQDMFCDICGYELELRVVNDILRNQAGCEWLNDASAENIAEIKIISEAVGVAPGAFKNISTTTDEEVIERIFKDVYFSEVISISKSKAEIDGGGAITVKFIFKGGQEKELYINNGNYRDDNGDYFELLIIPSFNEEDNATKSYGFITYQGYGELYDAGGNAICSFWMEELEFIRVTDDIVLDTKPITHYVETEFGKIYFLSDEYFYVEGIVEGDPWVGTKPQYFQLVGKNLEELIYDYTVLPD